MAITLHAELEELTRLGKISDSKDAACDPFSGSPDPFRLDPADFSTGVEVANALLESTPQDGEELIDFSKGDCKADLDSPCDCPRCQKEEAESMAYALADYKPKRDCECGGEFDEDDRCNSCDRGHDDCELQGCFACFERAMDRAERMAEGYDR